MNQRRPRKRRALGAGLAVVLLALFMLAPGMAIAESESDSATVDESAPARSSVMERGRKASPAERAEMRERLRDRMRDATPRQRRRIERRMRRLARALPDFTPIERLILLRAAADLPREEQDVLRRRIAGIDDLEADARAVWIADLTKMIQGVEGEGERRERNRDRWKGMTAAEKEEYRAQLKRLRKMSPEDRRALFDEMEKSQKR